MQEFYDCHLLDSSVVSQALHALASAESELYAIVRDAAAGIQTQQLFAAAGLVVKIVVFVGFVCSAGDLSAKRLKPRAAS